MISVRQTDNGSALHSALLSVIFKRLIFFFNLWRDTVASMKAAEELEMSANSLSQAKQIMKNSVRGERSMVEQEALGQVLSTLSCVPKMSALDMDLLTNNIECIDCTGRTLIFLQGDFGACFYIIATGNIELYLEPSKDKEMSNCRNFGVYRGSSFDLEQCGALGRHIVTLKAGQGFGEYAILSSTHKFRGATAVAADDCLLFIVYADTYNATLRKHHFRQQQMSSAIALLKELPIFNFQSNAKIAQFAYNLRCQTYSPRTVIAKANSKINTLYLINSGTIKVVVNASANNCTENDAQSDLEIPPITARRLDLCALELGRGQIIGLWEVLKDQVVYEMTYVSSASCELLEISRQYFQEVMSASKKIPARPGDGYHLAQLPGVTIPSTSTASVQKVPIFTTSMQTVRPRPVPHNKAIRENPLPSVSMESFYSSIRNAADDRENLHCGRLSRVQQALGDSEERDSGLHGMPDNRSILALFTENVDVTQRDPSVTGIRKSSISEPQKSSPLRPSPAYRKKSLPVNHLSEPPARLAVIQQYRNAVYHTTESSTTSVVCLSLNENRKSTNTTRDFVESTSVPSQPMIQFSKSRVNKSPNKLRRDLVTDTIR
mmetsp:Transcript_21474/g.36151  ORF Transcript_21474/g.36151 Transcript_21474/m.36151 type:complete len:606 (-) Transcript_21474:178-1995(-)